MRMLDAEGNSMGNGARGDESRAPTWHFISLIFAFLMASPTNPWGISVFHFIPLRGTATVIFTIVIGLNILLALYAILGFRIRGKECWFNNYENCSWKPRPIDILIGIAVGICLIAMSIIFETLFPGGRRNVAPELAKTDFDRSLELIMYFVVSICEEIQFRGYFLRQLVTLTSSTGMAVTLQAVIFVFMHGSSQGASGYLTRFGFGLAFGLVAVLRRSLWPSITAHLLINITAFALGLS
jgi:membrane protease YdiL (CAAX protease family)